LSIKRFKAMVVTETDNKKYIREIAEKSIDELPEGEVLVEVRYSSLNYKDALSAIGNKGVTKHYPHTPGVDASGIVAESASNDFRSGDQVIVHAYDLGMDTSGGFGQYIRVPAAWVLRLPGGLSLRESMIYGTAGFTAAQSVTKLEEQGVKPETGEILVTGATGGVGSIAVAILAISGYQVVAVTGKLGEKQFLIDLGVKEVMSRDEATDTSGRSLLKGRWAGVVDTVGGDILATAIKSTKYGGTVTCCGNVASHELPINVYPFILRGVSLAGIDSSNCPMDIRKKFWQKLSQEWKLEKLDDLANEISFEALDRNIELILQGKQKGRVVLDLWR